METMMTLLRGALTNTKIPDYMWESLLRYITEGGPTGGFLYAILTNDLKGACNKADDRNKLALYDYVAFLTNHAPAACWGSPERVKNWTLIAKQVAEVETDYRCKCGYRKSQHQDEKCPKLVGCFFEAR